MTTIQASNGYISILKDGAAEPELYPASAIETIPVIGNPGYVILKKVSNGEEVLPLTFYSNITNGDTGVAFASASAITTYVKSNFFYKAPGGGGNTTNALTFNNSGTGGSSGQTFNGSSPVAISYNSIGAAPVASPTFTGTPAAPLASTATNTTQLATTSFVQQELNNSKFQTYDYVITVSGGTTTASPRPGSGFTKQSGTDAYTVIQAAITALSTGNGGSIFITGTYNLTNELIITGWNSNNPTSASITIIGNGIATQINQSTSGKNAIIVKNSASITFRDFYVYTGSSAKSGILLSNAGTSEVSVFGGRIDNVFLQSDSTTDAPFHGIDFFDLQVDKLYALSSSNHGILLENNSTTTNYGNSHFGFVRASGGSTFAALKLNSNAVAFHYLDQITFDNFEAIAGLYGIYMLGNTFSTFNHVDIEGIKFPIYLDGTANNETLGNRFNGGYILPQGTGCVGITCVQYAGGNTFNLYVDGGSAVIPVSDVLVSSARASNEYNLSFGTNINAANISIASTQAMLTYKKASDGITVNKLDSINLSGLGTFSVNNITTTSTDSILLTNSQAATSGSQTQWSGALHFQGNYWTGSASAVSDWKIENQVTGTQGLLVFRYQNNGAGYNTAAYFGPSSFNSGGLINLNQGFIGSTSTDVLLIQNQAASTSGTTLQKSGRIRFFNSVWNSTATAAANYGHATVELTGVSGAIPTAALLWSTGLTTTTSVTITGKMSLDLASGNLSLLKGGLFENNTLTAVNASATLTALQVQTGVKTTSTSAVLFTMPTSTLLATQVGATQGSRFMFTLDNTASTSSGAITITLGTGMTSGLTAGLTVLIGKVQTYLIVFTSTTTCVMSQIL